MAGNLACPCYNIYNSICNRDLLVGICVKFVYCNWYRLLCVSELRIPTLSYSCPVRDDAIIFGSLQGKFMSGSTWE